MITEINKSWNWKGITAIEIIRTNDFGNVIFKTNKNDFWRICPVSIQIMKALFYIVVLLSFISCTTKHSDKKEQKPESWILIENYDDTSKFAPLGYTSGYVNANGDTVIPLDKYPRCFTDTFAYYAVVLDEHKGLIGINKKERKLFNAVWSGDAYPTMESDGMILITENEKYGYANHKGEIVIKPQFKCAANFVDGKAKVSNDCTEINDEHSKWKVHSWFYINKKGNKVDNQLHYSE
jgi:hypothetical protein